MVYRNKKERSEQKAEKLEDYFQNCGLKTAVKHCIYSTEVAKEMVYIIINVIIIIIVVVVVVIIIIIIIIPFMQGIYNYIPETNHVSTAYSVAAVLCLQFMLHVILFSPLNVFCTFTSALPAVCVQ
jgi:uncharacterized membrane protein